jgi:hypothetical protein
MGRDDSETLQCLRRQVVEWANRIVIVGCDGHIVAHALIAWQRIGAGIRVPANPSIATSRLTK